jgi:HD-like signal output (HDOD) protein
MATSNNTLDRIAQRAERLYSLPAVAVEVLRLTNSPKVDVQAVKACIENDPALTTKILRVVNSSLFGLSCQVSDLSQALALLGTKPLKLLVLGFSLHSGISSKGRRRGVVGAVLNRYWRTTLIKAVAARKLAQTVYSQDGDEAFLIALLEDLGMLVLIEQLGDTYADFVDKVWQSGGDLAQLEREALGFEHRQLSARLLADWGLPQQLIARRGESDSRESSSARVVDLAEVFAELLVDGRPERLETLRRQSRAIDEFKADRLQTFVEGLQLQVAELAKVLSLDTRAEPDYADIVARAHKQLAAAANDAVVELLDGSAGECQTQLLLEQVEYLSQAAASYANRGELPARAAARGESAAFELNDSVLLSRLQAVASQCRQTRLPLSLLAVELDNRTERTSLSSGASRKRIDSLYAACSWIDHADCQALVTSDASIAIILADCDRRQAKDAFRQLAAQYELEHAEGGTLSAGVATVAIVPRNFAAADLIDSAVRCLRAARRAGSSHLKTIEI